MDPIQSKNFRKNPSVHDCNMPTKGQLRIAGLHMEYVPIDSFPQLVFSFANIEGTAEQEIYYTTGLAVNKVFSLKMSNW